MILYFLYVNNKMEGPFTFDELKKLALHPEVLMWYKGLDNWQPAGQITHLNAFFLNNNTSHQYSLPPGTLPTNMNNSLNSTTANTLTDKKWLIVMLILLVILIASLCLFLYQNSQQAAFQKQMDLINAKLYQPQINDSLSINKQVILE